MTRPRSHLIDPNARGVYHLISRCVRRAWLCGFDSVTGRSFEHRRQWIEDRLHFLSQRFAVALHGYAVMSNHYHVVIEADPIEPHRWSDAEVAHRWLELYPPARWLRSDDSVAVDKTPELEALIADKNRVCACRQRLGSLSWFMRMMNEPLARLANREDGCKGRFWEGRFKSYALLDEAAWLAAAVYVDLNPFRARITAEPELGEHTSLRFRLQHPTPSIPNQMSPVATSLANPFKLPIGFEPYRALVKQTASRDRAAMSLTDLARAGVDASEWLAMMDAMKQRDRRAVGRIESLLAYLERIGQRWLRYLRRSANELHEAQVVHY